MDYTLETKVFGLIRSREYLAQHFIRDDRVGDPGAGNAQITFGTWRCDGRVVRVVRKKLLNVYNFDGDWLQDTLANEALATAHVSHMDGCPELLAWDPSSEVLIIEDMGRVNLNKYFAGKANGISLGDAEAVFYKTLCLISHLHAAGVYHFDLDWDNLVIDANTVDNAKMMGVQGKVSVIDLGASKVANGVHLAENHRSYRQPLDGSDWFEVKDSQLWREDLMDRWATVFPKFKKIGFGSGKVNGRCQDLCSFGNMVKTQIPPSEMADDLADLVQGVTADQLNERFHPGAPLHDHPFSKRMRARAAAEGWARIAPGSCDPTTSDSVSMPRMMPEDEFTAFRQVSAGFQDPVNLFKAMIASSIRMAHNGNTTEEAPAAVGASAVVADTSVVDDDDENGWGSRDRLPDLKGKGKAGSTIRPQISPAGGNSTATLEGAPGAAGAPPPTGAAVAAAAAPPQPAGAGQSRTKPRRSFSANAATDVVGAAEAGRKRGRGSDEVEEVGVAPTVASRARITKKVRGGPGSGTATRKRPRSDGEGVDSSDEADIGGRSAKRRRNGGGAGSGRKISSSGIAGAARAVRAKRSVAQPLTMTLRSRTKKTAGSVSVKKDIPNDKGSGDGSGGDGGGSSRQDGCQGGGGGSHAAATFSSSRYR